HRIDAMLSGTEAQIAIKLFGEDLQQLFTLGNQIKSVIGGVDGVVDANIEQQMERPQLDIRPRRQIMARYGVTIEDFRKFVDVALAGMTVSRVYEDSQPYDLTLKFDHGSRENIESISNLMIDTNQGKVPLSVIAEIVSTTGPNTINRENVKRRIVISANVADRDLGGVAEDIKKAVAENVELPENYYLVFSGQFENAESATNTLLWATLGAILIIFMLLYHEFHSLKESLIILANMPLAMIGGVYLLAITGGEVNIPAVIGFISLLGITTRNGMLLISRYNSLAAQGVGLDERVMNGSTDRLLPIIMTMLTSALALIPLAVKGGEPGNEIQSPMAVVILGGLLTATVMN
ncbi:MAG: efflux RND transporter permease subunit, partial [Muribaculaceae bacterium]|nr:efflux RND transporter permease subunit [Muribaculaceae bacterium]